MVEITELLCDKSKTCCFTGHRPEKLFPNEKDVSLDSAPVKKLLSVIAFHIDKMTAAGCDTFISGMARGVDLWAADLVLDLKRHNPAIKLICAMPHREHGSGFVGLDRWELCTILEEADKVVYVSDRYSKNCLAARNRFLVDNSSHLLGVVSDYRSGTGQTIRYARERCLDCDIIDLNDSSALFLPK